LGEEEITRKAKISGMLGIASKGYKLISGKEAVSDELLKKKVKLVIIAKDASEKTIENMQYLCEKQNVPCILYGTIFDNSKYIGKVNKAIIGIKDEGFANVLQKLILGGEEIGEN